MTDIVHPYYNHNESLRAQQLAQDKANRLGIDLVFGYCSYAGWTHAERTDAFGAASLGDPVLIQPD